MNEKMIRINKFLAKCGLGSRRKVEEFVTNGEVTVNGNTIYDLSFKVDPVQDIVKYKGKLVKASNDVVYIMLNKPPNYVVTKSDEFNRKTVYDLLPEEARLLNPIGRLDKDSEGLLLLTNDGEFSNNIIHPRYKLPKAYLVKVKGSINDEKVNRLRSGIIIEDKITNPAKVFLLEKTDSDAYLKIIINEGRKRQIRLMLKAVECEVTELKRTQIGEVSLGNLPRGMWRYLLPKEVLSLITMSRNKSRRNK